MAPLAAVTVVEVIALSYDANADVCLGGIKHKKYANYNKYSEVLTTNKTNHINTAIDPGISDWHLH